MNRNRTKLLSILLAATLAFHSAGITVAAASDIVPQDYIEIAANDRIQEMAIEDFAIPEADGSDIVSTDSETSNTEDSVGTVDGDETDTADMLFPGLPEQYVLSGKQLNDKHLLSEHTDDVVPYAVKDNTSLYVKGQLIYLTDSAEDAQVVAEAFGGTLDSYEYNVAVILLPENRTVAQAVLAAANKETRLPAVWPNYYQQLHVSYNDPALDDGQANYQWQHEAVGSSYAWASGYKGQGIKVGVIDSGILNAHEEFGGRIQQHLSALTAPMNTSTTDINGHGTHVSGIIAANLDNGKGGAGIAPEASLYVYDVTDADGVLSSDVTIRAIERAITDGVDVLNMSFGSGTFNGAQNEAIQKAYKSGIALFASAGNEATNGKSYPASYDNVCSIASLQQDGRKSNFSNYNDSVDLAFPGSGIYSTYASGSDSYLYMDGTSMACPVASGVAAVILSGADDVPALKGKTGTARVDALYTVMRSNAVKSSSTGTGAGTTYLPSVFKLTVDNASAVPALPKFDLNSKNAITTETATLAITCASTVGVDIYYSTDGKTPALKNGKVTNGTRYTAPISIGGAKKVTVKAIAVNIATGKSSKAATATYTFSPNPSKVTITDTVNKLAPGSNLALKAVVTPSYAVSTKVKWAVAPEGQGVTVNASGKVAVSKTATSGTYTVTATAVDKSGNAYTNSGKTVSSTYEITVLTPESSVKSVAFTNKAVEVTVGGTPLNLSAGVTVTYANGSTGTAADVVWSSSNTKIATVSKDGLVTGIAPGKVSITATANDGTGKKATCTVTVKQLATGLTISGSSKLAAGKSTTLKATLAPNNVSAKSLNWEVTGTGVTVKNGKVTASKDASGSCTITATTTDGSNTSATHTITIVKDPIKSITLPKTMTLFTTTGNYNAPTTGTLNPVVNGGDSTAITYTSSAPEIASVAPNGKVTAHASGKAKITCTATDGSNKKAVCTVTVNVPMSRLTIVPADANDGYVCVGSTLKLKTQAGSSFGKPQNTKVNWIVPEQYKDIFSVSGSGVIKAKALDRYNDNYEIDLDVYVIAEAADGSGVQAVYDFTIYRKVKDVKLVADSYNGVPYLCPVVLFDNNKAFAMPNDFNITLSAPKGKNIGYQPYEDGFVLTTDKPTTTKSSYASNFYTSDAIKVTIKAKFQACNKSTSTTIYLIRTTDGYNIMGQLENK